MQHDEVSTRRVSPERIGWVLLTLATFLGVVAGWVLVAMVWNDMREQESYVFDVGLVLVTIGMALVTAAAIASLRLRRLRIALLPLQLGVLIGAVIVAADMRGSEVDTQGDTVGIAIMFGVGGAVLLSFVSVLLEGTGRRGRWLSGLAAVIAVLGVSTPLLLERFEPSPFDAARAAEFENSMLLAALTRDHHVSLGTISVGIPDPRQPVGATAATPAMAYPVEATSGGVGGRLDVLATSTNTITVRIRPAMDGARTALVQLRSGPCVEDGRELDSWEAPVGRMTEREVGVTVRELVESAPMHVRWGSGEPLAHRACMDFGATAAPLLALEGAGDFSRECLAPLELADEERRRMTPEAFQDEDCASRMRALTRVANGMSFRSERRAREVAECVDEVATGVRRLRSSGMWLVSLDPEAGFRSDPWHCAFGTPGERPFGADSAAYGVATAATAPDPACFECAVAVRVDPATGLPFDPLADPDGDGDPSPEDLEKIR